MTSRRDKSDINLHNAIKNNRTEEVHRIIQALEVNSQKELCLREVGSTGTALHVASEYGHGDIVDAILQTGVSVDIKQTQSHLVSGLTPLHIAVSNHQVEIAQKLLVIGANVNLQESEGLTAMHFACQHPKNIDLVKILVENDADVNIKDSGGRSPLQICLLRGSNEMSRYLIENKADINALDKEGQSLLHYASEWGNTDLVSFLVGKGACVNAQDNEGKTPLHVTADDEVMAILVKNGGDIEMRDKLGRKPTLGRIAMDDYQNIDSVLGSHFSRIQVKEGSPASDGKQADSHHSMWSQSQRSIEDHSVPINRKYIPSPLATSGVLDQLKSTVPPATTSAAVSTESTSPPLTSVGVLDQMKTKTSPLAAAGVLDQLKSTSPLERGFSTEGNLMDRD